MAVSSNPSQHEQPHPSSSSTNTSGQLQKEEPSAAPPTPPPAYFPRPTSASLAAQDYLAARFAGHPPPRSLPARYPVPAAALPTSVPIPFQSRWSSPQQHQASADAEVWDDGEDGEYDDSNNSAIVIRISTGVRVSGDDNVVCLAGGAANGQTNNNNGQSSSSSAAADHARSIAEAVTAAIRQGGEQDVGGIPMIDEEGRPRGIRVQIEAGIEVRGKGNVLVDGGEEGEGYAVVGALADRLVKRQKKMAKNGNKREHRKRRREDRVEEEEEEEGEGEGEEEGSTERRRRQRRRIVEPRLMGPHDRCASV